MNAATFYDWTNYRIILSPASSNAFLKWAKVEGSLLRRPALRLFQTEWEMVVEEINK